MAWVTVSGSNSIWQYENGATASDTYGGRLIGTIGSDMRAGIDYEHNRKDAEQEASKWNTGVVVEFS